jgi:hypothetical protein
LHVWGDVGYYNYCSSFGEVAELVEGAPLLREYTGNSIEGSNPFFSSISVPLAQPDRAFDYESKGREFESLRARHPEQATPHLSLVRFFIPAPVAQQDRAIVS